MSNATRANGSRGLPGARRSASRLTEERLLGLVGGIYDAALDPERWQRLADDLADLYSGTAAISTQDPLGSAARISASSGIDPSFARSYETYYVGRRPWASRVGEIAVGEVFTPRTLFDGADYERTEYFNDWLKPQDIYHLTSLSVARRGAGTTFLTLSRARRADEFSGEELRLACQLVPHLQRAVAMHWRLHTMEQRCDGLKHALERLGIGVILVDCDGRIGFLNEIAEAILRRGEGLVARHQRLRARTNAATSSLCRLIDGAARTGAGLGMASGGVIALPCGDGRSLHALVCPFPVSRAEWAERYAPTALIFVSEAECNLMLRPADLQQLYGLSPAEAKLMSALAGGSTIDRYVQSAKISRATAKTQLQHIFAKTGCNRQSDIVRAAFASNIARIAASKS